MHYALEVFEREWRSGADWADAKQGAIETFRHYWNPLYIADICPPVERWLPAQSYAGLERRGVEALTWYATWAKDQDEELLATEFSFQVPIEGTWDYDAEEPHILAGTIDRLSFTHMRAKPVLMIADYKTGRDHTYLRQNLQFTSYCASPDTPVLMADYTWKALGKINAGDRILGFDESTSSTRRRWHTSTVTHSWATRKNAFQISLSDGRTLIASADHQWLPAPLKRGHQRAKKTDGWLRTDDLRLGDQLAAIFEPVLVDYDGEDYRHGYITGATLGDGCISHPATTGQPFWQLTKGECDHEVFDRLKTFLADLPGPLPAVRVRQPNGKGWQKNPLSVLSTHRQDNVAALAAILVPRDTDAWRLGWLAGLYDTDGSFNPVGQTLCLHQKDLQVLQQVCQYAASFGLRFEVVDRTREDGCSYARLMGERMDRVKFFSITQPALRRKRESLDDRTVRIFKPVEVLDIQPLGQTDLHDITTTTGTFVANGVLTHNCYATTRKEFWLGWRGEDGFGDRGQALYERLRPVARRGTWIGLKSLKVMDAGWRGPDDYTRFALAVEQVAASMKADIYPLSLSGENCMFCTFRDFCAGVGVPESTHGAPA